MDSFLQQSRAFFTENLPSYPVLFTAGPAGFMWALICLCIAAYLKKEMGWRTGYTRKVFHFLIFISVALLQWLWGTSTVCLFGGMTSCVVFLAILLGPGHALYEAIAREKDAPHRTHYIIVPYFATLIGGIAGNILFGPVAITGYLVTGLGDAAGEPVGVRFGKHRYRVPSLTSVQAFRTWEGSAAVFIASLAAFAAGVALSPQLQFGLSSIWILPAVAAASALLEAVSPHGWDNLTLQVVPSMLAFLLMSP